MRFTRTAFTTFLFAALLTAPLAARTRTLPPADLCQKVYAEASTTWVGQPGVEVGEVAGTLNGALYLDYDDQAPPIDPSQAAANLVIYNKGGQINLWVYADSVEQSRNYWREFKILAIAGTGTYAKETLTLEITGQGAPGKGGEYVVTGSACPGK
jgi:hypothetical protein